MVDYNRHKRKKGRVQPKTRAENKWTTGKIKILTNLKRRTLQKREIQHRLIFVTQAKFRGWAASSEHLGGRGPLTIRKVFGERYD